VLVVVVVVLVIVVVASQVSVVSYLYRLPKMTVGMEPMEERVWATDRSLSQMTPLSLRL
jgi:hypothetical protein